MDLLASDDQWFGVGGIPFARFFNNNFKNQFL